MEKYFVLHFFNPQVFSTAKIEQWYFVTCNECKFSSLLTSKEQKSKSTVPLALNGLRAVVSREIFPATAFDHKLAGAFD